jgi:hypothetical protein
MQQAEATVLRMVMLVCVEAAPLAEAGGAIPGDRPTLATGGILVHQTQDPSVKFVSSEVASECWH